jgi:hypothetical protein
MHRIFCYICLVVIAVVGFENAPAQSVILNWNASSSSDVTGYNVYYGTNSGNYPYKVDAGNATALTVSNLVPGLTYYFAATAYDGVGDESGYSSEIAYIVPGFMMMTPGAGPNSPAQLQFPVAPGHWYEVQATTDLVNWSSIWQSDVMASNYWMQFTDPNAGSFSSRFYRLVLH